jgi:hypothetical protein
VNEAEALDRRAFKRHPRHPLHQLQAARFYAAIGSLGKVRAVLRGLDEAGLDDASARHFAHLLGLALLDAGEHDEAYRVLVSGQSRAGYCDLDALIAIAARPFATEDVPSSQRSLREVIDRVAAADARLSANDAAGARTLLDDVLVWEACEVQSMARLTRAMLNINDASADFRLRKFLAIATFAELCSDRSGGRREILLRGRWDQEQFSLLLSDAMAWLNEFGRETLESAADAGR